MKINKIILFSVLGLLFSVSTCLASWTINNDYLDSNTGSGAGTAYEPVASPAAGAFTSSQSVGLSATNASSIHYTVDGTTPSCTNGTVYSAAIIVNSNQTIKAISCYADNGGTMSASNVSSHAYTFSCSSVSNAATYNAYPTCGPATCSTGYTLSGGACIAQSSGGGGGGGISSTPCSTVTYSDWATTCFNGIQFRNVLTQAPSGCALTSAQQAAEQRSCQATATSTPPVEQETPNSGANSGANSGTGSGANADVKLFEALKNESQIVGSNNTDSLLNHLGTTANSVQEQSGLTKYKTILGLDKKITAEEKLTINDFIVYGTHSTQRLGAGERAAVINSYYQAYGKLPNSEVEWFDVIKIANGRWPIERNLAAENRAKVEFKKVYVRNAVMTNNIDENAIMVISYGLLPLQRNLNSEKVAIKTFRYVYGHDPITALAWNVVRAIAYSGAKR